MMGTSDCGTEYISEWSLKSYWGITYERWKFWRLKGLTPQQINKRFG